MIYLTEDQIKYMVDRFLGWRLPNDFNPDAGIKYTRPNYAPSVDATPSGTNLLDARQADAMVRYMIDGILSTVLPTEGLLFVCDEAACHEDPMFYEIFTMDDRWSIIRAVLKAAEAHKIASTVSSAQGEGK